MFKKGLTLVFLIFSTSSVWAYHSLLTNGHFLESGEYRLLSEVQFLTTVDSGVNINFHGESYLTDDLNLKASLGFGTTQFNLSAYIKWVPIPDLDKQPAIGVLGGLAFGQFEDENDFSLKVSPFISKHFDLEIGELTPYLAVAFSVRNHNSTTSTPLQLVIGNELLSFDWSHIRFFAEAGFDLNESFSYFSLAASVDIDRISGFMFY
jgi:hypothetical protein